MRDRSQRTRAKLLCHMFACASSAFFRRQISLACLVFLSLRKRPAGGRRIYRGLYGSVFLLSCIGVMRVFLDGFPVPSAMSASSSMRGLSDALSLCPVHVISPRLGLSEKLGLIHTFSLPFLSKVGSRDISATVLSRTLESCAVVHIGVDGRPHFFAASHLETSLTELSGDKPGTSL